MAHDRRYFGRFTPTFKCSICERMTRNTGQGVDHLCEDCFEIAGMDNHCNDCGETAEQAGYLKERESRLRHIQKLGGDISKVIEFNSYLFEEGYTLPEKSTAPKPTETKAEARKRRRLARKAKKLALAQQST